MIKWHCFILLWAVQKPVCLYKLVSRHRVARYEPVCLLFLKDCENVAQIFEYIVSERTFLTHIFGSGGFLEQHTFTSIEIWV